MTDVVEKKSKKNKRAREEAAVAEVPAVEEPAKKKKKKDKKEKKDKAEEAEASTEAASASPTETPAESEEPAKEKKEKKQKKDKKQTGTEASNRAVAVIENPFYTENNIMVQVEGLEKIGKKAQPIKSFKALGEAPCGYPAAIVKGLEAQGFAAPTPIQSTAWPLIAHGMDMFGISKTGSGKTLAFTIPFLAKILLEKEQGVARRAANEAAFLAVAPTKELAQQIAEVAEKFCATVPALKEMVNVVCIIGGVSKGLQRGMINAREKRNSSALMVVATAGRLEDVVVNDEMVKVDKCHFLVLDEADRMMDVSFLPVMRTIANLCVHPERQTMLFSATWPMEVSRIARELVRDGGKGTQGLATVTVGKKDGDAIVDADGNINTEDKLALNTDITQTVHVIKAQGRAADNVKWPLLQKYLQGPTGKKKMIIFGLVKREVARLEEWLKGAGYNCRAIHGDLTQSARESAIADFKDNKSRMLVATDVAARGLDIPDVELVFNYTFPLTTEDLVHRTGRTGRAGRKGEAITIFNSEGDFDEKNHTFDLMRLLEEAQQTVPADLRELNKNTFTATKKKAHALYGNYFKDEATMAALEKKKVKISFDSDSD